MTSSAPAHQAVADSQPVILGVRHHSPACARRVLHVFENLRPAFVLIEGPADFNSRLDEMALGHRLPIAIYSYLSGTLGGEQVQRGSWTPFAEHSPEWQALVAGRSTGAQLRFIDLPAWHEAFADTLNRYADNDDEAQERCAREYEQQLAASLAIDGRDALWDHLFEAESDPDKLGTTLDTYFTHLRNTDKGSIGNQQREEMMSRWIAWAMVQNSGPVVVVCGGYHASALSRGWQDWRAGYAKGAPEPETPQPETPQPETPQPAEAAALPLNTTVSSAGPADVLDIRPLRFGSFLVPYEFRRLDSFAGYASGMPSPAFYQRVWEHGLQEAGLSALQAIVARLRGRNLAASTADLMAVHARAQGLSRLRGHASPQRTDWLDALAGALVKEAMDAPLPWSYRGPIRPGTDPVLVEIMDVLAGDAVGGLAAGTPQPPLVQSMWDELQKAGIPVTAQTQFLKLDLMSDTGRLQSRLLHRVALLKLPGFVRYSGPDLALSGVREERWTLSRPMAQLAALIEAGAWGATLEDAARSCLEDQLRGAGGDIEAMAQGLNQAAFAGLNALSRGLLDELARAIEHEGRFEVLGTAMGILFALLRHGEWLGMADAPVLRVVVEAGFDRALWLLEPPAAIAPAMHHAHLKSVLTLRQIVADRLEDPALGDGLALAIEPARALAVFDRKAASADSAPLSRGAAMGALISLRPRFNTAALAEPEASAEHHGTAEQGDPLEQQALHWLTSLSVQQLGDALSGLLALAREQLFDESAFLAGLDRHFQSLDDAEFVMALPALRAAFAWLPTRERGAVAEQVLALHQAGHVSGRSLTHSHSPWPAESIANHRLAETRAWQHLQAWGVVNA